MSKSIEAYDDEDRVRRYDSDMDLMHPNRHKMVDVALEVLPIARDAGITALDLGMGTGFFASRFLREFPRATLIGIDGSPAMIRLAKTRLSEFGARVRFLTVSFAGFDTADIAPASLGLVFSSYALHHVGRADKQRLLTSVARRLKDNGWFLNADLASSDFPEIEGIVEGIRVRGIHSRDSGPKPRFSDMESIRVFIQGLQDNEGDQPLPVDEDLRLMRAAGISNATVFWQEYREVVYGGWKRASTP